MRRLRLPHLSKQTTVVFEGSQPARLDPQALTSRWKWQVRARVGVIRYGPGGSIAGGRGKAA